MIRKNKRVQNENPDKHLPVLTAEGLGVGFAEGNVVGTGEADGAPAMNVGATVGLPDGATVGRTVGGVGLGAAVGATVGVEMGASDGLNEGVAVGTALG